MSGAVAGLQGGNDMTHTPGPWTKETDGTSGVFWIYSDFHGDESNALATVHGQDDIPEMDDGECEANAALIAAAPDLLEACQAARDWYAKNTKQGHTPGPVEQALIDAIAKAEAKP